MLCPADRAQNPARLPPADAGVRQQPPAVGAARASPLGSICIAFVARASWGDAGHVLASKWQRQRACAVARTRRRSYVQKLLTRLHMEAKQTSYATRNMHGLAAGAVLLTCISLSSASLTCIYKASMDSLCSSKT